ncbi:uncharacterized protein [Gossypium hirsutum]|uniref:Uncharacterized protein n=1 Tax=Gossypium hirsutum TaxID=3635 RepID=A0ABM3AT13_GOSHI|nr:uncharacterized protein LOC121222114 [Gossypium hirsutum]
MQKRRRFRGFLTLPKRRRFGSLYKSNPPKKNHFIPLFKKKFQNSFSPSLFSGQGPGQEPPCRPPVAGAGAAVHGGRETKSLSFFSPMPLLDLPNAPVTAKKAGSWANGRKQVNGGAGEKARGKDVRR